MAYRFLTSFLILWAAVFVSPAMGQSQSIPQPGYDATYSADPDPIYSASYIYHGVVKEVYDSDTINLDIDFGFNFWQRDVNVRYAGTNAYEVKRSSSKRFRGRPIDNAHVAIGFQCRDLMIEWLGGNPALYPQKAVYHEMVPSNASAELLADLPEDWRKYGGPRVVVQTLADESGKFGRPLVIIWKDGRNLNQLLVRSGCADLNWYDGKEYPKNSPIMPR